MQRRFSPQSEGDTCLIIAESGSAFTLLHPEFEVVVLDELKVQQPLFYAMGQRDSAMKNFLAALGLTQT